MKIVKIGVSQYKISGIPQLSFDSYWSARAYLSSL